MGLSSCVGAFSHEPGLDCFKVDCSHDHGTVVIRGPLRIEGNNEKVEEAVILSAA